MNHSGLVNASSIVDNAVANISQQQAQFIAGDSPAGERLVEAVCHKLKALTKGYMKKMGNPAGEAEYKRQLLAAFAENRIGCIEDISGALALYRSEDRWCPTPAELVELILKTRHGGIPGAESAYIEYCRNFANPKHEWSHPIVVESVRQGQCAYEVKSLPREKGFPIYERSYKVLLERLRNGESIETPIPKAIPEKIERPLDHKENKSRLADLRGNIGL